MQRIIATLLPQALVITGLLLTSCKAEDPQTSTDLKVIAACMEAQHTTDDYVLVTKCEPLGPQRKFQGTWFVGFELSVFRNDYAGVPAEPNGHEYDLVAPALVSGRAHARDRAGVSAYQVSFLGREYQVANKPDLNHLVADRMLSLRLVPMSPGFTVRR